MRSGLQRDVLVLYRLVLRAARTKAPALDADSGAAVRAFARAEFERHRGLGLRQTQLVEHLLRKGHKQLEQLRSPGFTRFAWQRPPSLAPADAPAAGGLPSGR